jgi:predicted NAD-dependent protein-ADP-ribosyltransferase YbiA (DUF1768 family)
MVQSRIIKDVQYPEIHEVIKSDKGKYSVLFEIQYKDEDITIALGEVKDRFTNHNLFYIPIYLKKNIDNYEYDDAIPIGIYEFLMDDYTNIFDEEGDVDPNKLSDPLYFSFIDGKFLSGGGKKTPKEEKDYTKGTEWIQKFMKNRDYNITDCGGGGDCFFFVIWNAFNKSDKYSVEKLRQILSIEADEELYKTYKHLYNDFIGSIEKDQKEIEALKTDKVLDEFKKKLKDLNASSKNTKKKWEKAWKKDKDRDKAKKIVEEGKSIIKEFNKTKKEYTSEKGKVSDKIKRLEKDILNTRELITEHNFMKNIDSLGELKEFMKTSDYWADTWAISTIERLLNIKLIILSKENFLQKNFNNVLLCGQINDEEMDDETFMFNPNFYIMAEHNGIHYRLISYKKKKLFEYIQLPYYMKELIIKHCLKTEAGLYAQIPEFKEASKKVMRPRENAAATIQKQWRKSRTEKLFDENIVFQFHSGSANKPPGKGSGEKGNQKDFKELVEIDKHWRRVLSNSYTEKGVPLFEADDKGWASVEHYYNAGKFKKGNPEFYEKFSYQSGSPFAKDPLMASAAGGKTGVFTKKIEKDGGKKTSRTMLRNPKNIKTDKDFDSLGWMDEVLRKKFTQNEKAKAVLLATKKAKLVHYVKLRGKKAENSNEEQLMQIRNELTK